jgi:hypothetical protein
LRTIDIINLLQAFDRVFEDSALTNDEKIAVGNEVLIQLPHAHLLPTVLASINAATRSIEARLATLEKPSGATAETGRPKGPKNAVGKKPLRNTEPDA